MNIEDTINQAFEDRASLNPKTASNEIKEAVAEVIHLLDSGKMRVAQQNGVGNWSVNEWLKKSGITLI